MLLMDRVFLEHYRDNYYLRRRKKAVVIGLDSMPTSLSFEESAGTDTVDKGYDLFLTPLGGKYYIEVGTGKGRELLKLIKGLSTSI